MTTEQIVKRFAELDHEISTDDVDSRVNTMTGRFKVPQSDAENSVISYLCRENGVDKSEYYKGSGGNVTSQINDILIKEDIWYNLRVKFVNDWESDSEFINQTGLVGDETGKIKFVSWRNDGFPKMELGKCYALDNVVTKVYNNMTSISLNKTSVITEIDDDIEVTMNITEFTGVLVNIRKGSGLIKRCPICNRALIAGACADHGNVEGTTDLRIMGTLDDGRTTHDILLGLEMTEKMWGHTMDEAILMAADAFDSNVVIEDMTSSLVGKYFTMSGSAMEDMLLVKEIEVI